MFRGASSWPTLLEAEAIKRKFKLTGDAGVDVVVVAAGGVVDVVDAAAVVGIPSCREYRVWWVTSSGLARSGS